MPATIQNPQAKSIYAVAGTNYAPKSGIVQDQKNGRTKSPSKFCEAMLKKYQDFQKRDEEVWYELYQIGRMIANCKNDKLLLVRHAIDNRYVFVQRDTRFADNKVISGQFRFYTTKLDAEWLSSRPEIDPICPSEQDQIEAFIDDVKIIQDYYDRKFFTTQYELKESDSAQCYGTWVTRFRFDPDKQDIVCELLDFPACRWDIRYDADESPYFIYESTCSTSVLSQLLDYDVPEDEPSSGEHYGLQLRNWIATQGGGVRGQGQEYPYGTTDGQNRKEAVVTEMWLQPEAYCDIELSVDEATLGGKKLPANTNLMELFPDGMCVVGINSMRTIIGVYAENHKEHIVPGKYHLQSFSGVGQGVSSAVDLYKERNDLHSQIMAYIKTHGTPAWGYNKDMVSEEDARNIGRPRKNIPFDFTNAPEGVRSVNEAVQALQPGNPASGMFEYASQLENFQQLAFQVTNFSDGLPGVDNKTATGAIQGKETAQTLLVPQHRNKADHRMRCDKVIYNLFRKYVNAPKFFASNSKNGITAGKALSGSDFDGVDIEFEIVADSERPNTPVMKAMALNTLLQQTGGLPGLIQSAQMNPDITGDVVKTFGSPINIPSESDIAKVCRNRIEQAKKILTKDLAIQGIMTQVTGQTPNNADIASQVVSQLMPPISPKEPDVMRKVAWLSKLLDADELQYAPMELRYVIEEMIDVHLQEATLGAAQVEQDKNIATVIANAPMLLGQAVMEQKNQQLIQQQQQAQQEQQMQQQQVQAQAQNQQQLQMENQKAQVANQASEAEHQRALALNDQQHAQDMAKQNVAHQQNLREAALGHLAAIEAAKAKPTAKAA